MVTRIRKVRHLRGSRTHGWGQIAQHRKSGSQGGRGKAGLHKHKWSWVVKYEPDHFGHQKLNPPRRNIVTRWINVGQLDGLFAPTFSDNANGGGRSGPGKHQSDGSPLRLDHLGFQKLLGKGTVKGSYNISIPKYSESAKLKIEKAGGKITGAVEEPVIAEKEKKAGVEEKPKGLPKTPEQKEEKEKRERKSKEKETKRKVAERRKKAERQSRNEVA